MSVLADPSHIRYRWYWWIEDRSHVYSRTFGETGLARALHYQCLQPSGWPMYTPKNYLGLNMVVADYYHAEVVELDDQRNWNPPNHNNGHPPAPYFYVPRVRGDPANPQIILIKEEHHFLSGTTAVRIPTAGLDRVDPYFPWLYGLNLATLAPGLLPTPMPAGSGINDPAMIANARDRGFQTANIMAPGLMPVRPTVAVMNSWASQVPAGGPPLGSTTTHTVKGRHPERAPKEATKDNIVHR